MMTVKKVSVRPVVVLAGLVLVTAIVGCKVAAPPPEKKVQVPEKPVETVVTPRPPSTKTWNQVYEESKDAAVDVYILTPSDNPNVFGAVVGAGVIINKAGYILTNSHVVSAQGRRLVGLADGSKLLFRIIGQSDARDLAIIKIDVDRTFTPIKIGNSSELQVGDPVMAIGNPNGRPHSRTVGKVEAVDQGWGYEWGDGGTWYRRMIRTDARIAPGYSGGPLINKYAEVIGTSSGSMGGQAGFAIPIDTMKRVLPEILDVEDSRGFVLGMKVAGLGRGDVIEVTKGSPADAAGIKVGDVVTTINGKPVNVGFDFYLALLDSSPGDMLNLKVERDGTASDETIALGKIEPREPVRVDGLANGVFVEYYKGEWEKLPDFDKLTPDQSAPLETIDFRPFKGQEAFGLRIRGFIKVPTDGAYAFYLASDDGSRMWIHDQLLIDNDGLHGTVTKKAYAWLKAGLHPIKIEYFDRGGGDSLIVKYQGPGIPKQPIPNSALFFK